MEALLVVIETASLTTLYAACIDSFCKEGNDAINSSSVKSRLLFIDLVTKQTQIYIHQ